MAFIILLCWPVATAEVLILRSELRATVELEATLLS